MLEQLYNEIMSFLGMFDLIEGAVITVNLVLMVFAGKIMRAIYHEPETSPQFKFRVNIFRVFNFLIIIAFTYYHLYSTESSKSLGFKVVAIVVILYLSYAGLHLLQFLIRKKYGKTREIEGVGQPVETYNSRLFSIFATMFVFVIAFISIIRIMGFDSLLEAGGAIGIVGVFLALTQNAWAPDMFSGLIILNSGMVEVGDVVEFNEGDKSLGVVYKTKVFHTEILNLINNHRIMIKNSRLREQTIHNLSKFASAKGLREQLHFKIDYAEDEQKVRKMFTTAFEKAVANEDILVEEQIPIEIGVIDTGDHAVEWCVYYYTKQVKSLIRTRQLFREEILKTSKETGISLATPLTHIIEKNSQL